jgi:serine phosphatase RsbU (regulator of sigma subunit)
MSADHENLQAGSGRDVWQALNKPVQKNKETTEALRRSSQMAYANTGHPPPFHVRRGAGVVEALDFTEDHGPALGIFKDGEYCTGYSATASQDLLVFFTGRLFEFEISRGEFYGQERLPAAVRERVRLPASELFRQLLAEVRERCMRREFEDDVCLVGMEVMRTGLADTSRRVA